MQGFGFFFREGGGVLGKVRQKDVTGGQRKWRSARFDQT